MLNSGYQPLGAISYEEAICLVVQEKGWVLEEHPDKIYRSQHISLNAPTVLVLYHFVVPEGFQFKPEQLNNSNLFRRDGYTCQYCGRGQSNLHSWEKLTRDHIIPLARNGKDTWDNVVTACSSCNFEKADQTPEEASMILHTRPKDPITWVIRGKAKLSQKQVRLAEKLLGLIQTIVEDTNGD